MLKHPSASVPGVSTDSPAAAKRSRVLRLCAGRSLRRRTRCIVRVAVATPLLLALAVLIAVRSPLVGELVAREVGEKLGCEFSGRGALMDMGGKLLITRPRLTVPGMEGDAARFMEAASAEVELDWTRGLLSGPRPKRVRLVSPVLRVSVAMEDGSLNLDGLGPAAAGATGAGVPPAVQIIDGRLELGEHSQRTGAYTRLQSIPVSGRLAPAPGKTDAAPAYTVQLSQTGPAIGAPPAPRGGDGSRAGMLLEGSIDLGSSDAELTLRNVSLEQWPPEVMPSAVRDIWRRLNIEGTVSEASLRYSPERGVQAAVALDGVSMDALVPADRPEFGGAEKPLELTGVTGSIKLSRDGIDALLEGMVGDLPGRISLRTSGTSLDAPLRCEITTKRFAVSQSPELMPYAPSIVRKRFASFSGPTAVVDARVLIERGEPVDGQAAPIQASGSIAFENGRAAFEKFPYPFEDLRGLVTFNEDRIEIVNITGRGPTGAILSAEGLITPANEDPRVEIDVLALDMPVDDVLRAAMPPDRRAILDELFNHERYDELVARGLVLTPQRHAELTAELAAAREAGTPADRVAALERELRTPVFEVGGAAEVSVHVTRPEGEGGEFEHRVRVRLPRAGLLPEGFALPIVARDVVLEIGERRAELTGGVFEGLTGGRAEVEAVIDLRDDRDAPAMRPHVTIRADDVPVDALLLHAIPDRDARADAAAGGADAGLSTKGLLASLNLEGTVDCVAAITPATGERAAAGKRIAVEVDVALNGLRALPGPLGRPGSLALEGLAGAIRVTDEGLSIDGLRARLERRGGDPDQTAGAGEIELDAVAAFADARRGREASLKAGVTARGLDVAAPLEELVSLVSARAGEKVGGLRERHKVAGRVDARVEIGQEGAGPTAIAVRVGAARGLEFDALGGRFGVGTTAGEAVLTIGRDADAVAFHGLEGEVWFNDGRMMTVELDGEAPLLSRNDLAPEKESSLSVRLRGVKLDSGLSHAAIRAVLAGPGGDGGGARSAASEFRSGEPAATNSRWAWLETMDPRGEFDADLIVTPRRAKPEAAPVASPAVAGAGAGVGTEGPASATKAAHAPVVSLDRYTVTGSIWPRSVSLVYNGALLDLPSVTGRVVLGDRGGRIENLRAAAAEERWHIGIDGSWQADRDAAGPGVKVDSRLTLAASSLDPSLVALLPKGIRDAMERSRVRMDGPFSIDGARLAFWAPTGRRVEPPPGAKRIQVAPGAGVLLFNGELQLTELTADAGVPVEYGAGTVAVLVQRNHDDKEPLIDVTLRADTLSVGGVPMTGAKGRLVSSLRPGQLIVPQFTAECLGGRMALSGVLDNITTGGEDGKASPGAAGYRLSATLAGTRFAPLLASIEAATKKGKGTQRRPDPMDESRGRLDASVSISGIFGRDDTRVGRGSIRIAGGDVVQLPGLVRMIELSNLQVPSAERLDYVQAGFDIKGRTITFEEVAVMSESLTITGSGEVTLPEGKLDFRFNSQAAAGRRIPVVSGVIEALRNELVTTVVGGTIKKPKVRTESLSGTRRMFAGIFGGGDGDAPEIDRSEVARAARTERERLRMQRSTPGTMAPALTLPGDAPARPPVGRETGLSKAGRADAAAPAPGDLR